VLGDKHGNVVYLGERECSIQRRNQKVIEEAPSPFLDARTRKRMGEQAVALARAVGYESAGTVEFIVDKNKKFYFLEMNTRLQVEHPVTEFVTDLDLVELMLRVAAGEKLPMEQKDIKPFGWSIECRLYAEDPYRNFLPSVGRLTRYRPPREGHWETRCVRNDTGVVEGGEISTYYDPMISKLVTWAPDRAGAIAAMADALDEFEVEGVGHNLPFLSTVIAQERFGEGRLSTGYIAEEFAGGFAGARLTAEVEERIAAFAACAAYAHETRGFVGSGSELHHPSHERSVVIGGRQWTFAISERHGEYWLQQEGHKTLVEMNWSPGDSIARARVDGEVLVMKVSRETGGFRIRYRGADLKVKVLLPHVAALLPLMPVKTAADLSKFLICPMPGQIVRIDVAAGDVVEEGQPLAIVEAMKMENVLKAERRARVAKVRVKPGDVLAVDEVILEFEAA
jgi:propionyl-CoA carboxylase alpha chain